ncbi:hypothetical protein FOQG_04888 [Fusarium oxysporum f. sp. raphani 54005]|uniref:Uncharacterized protein n=1 Tax=Fusarium oxysporum f. sp. raphani 54005 TaxID=1089458 RepID=X0CRX7_FUSOX|nr:hypothetical protein FOQG_04888 [Fusarium oxysporum f. sp. raphani 54005]
MNTESISMGNIKGAISDPRGSHGSCKSLMDRSSAPQRPEKIVAPCPSVFPDLLLRKRGAEHHDELTG